MKIPFLHITLLGSFKILLFFIYKVYLQIYTERYSPELWIIYYRNVKANNAVIFSMGVNPVWSLKPIDFFILRLALVLEDFLITLKLFRDLKCATSFGMAQVSNDFQNIITLNDNH